MDVRPEWAEVLLRYESKAGTTTMFGEPIADATRDELLLMVELLGDTIQRERERIAEAAKFLRAINVA